MAYRRRSGTRRSTTFEDIRVVPADQDGDGSDYSSVPSPSSFSPLASRTYQKQGSNIYEYSSRQASRFSRNGFWDILAQKAKSIVEDDKTCRQVEIHDSSSSHVLNSADAQAETKWSADRYWKADDPPVQKETTTSSLKEISGTTRNTLEEGISTTRENKTHIISETKKLQIGSLCDNPHAANHANLTDLKEYEKQLKSSKKVANAMAAKAKLLLRELKTVKADLAFSKQRCTQLEEENKVLREHRQKGTNPADDDLIRHQLETLLAEKARLAHENSVYARENRFLREIVEYHQLTMHNVAEFDDGIEGASDVSSPVPSMNEVLSPFFSSSNLVTPRFWPLSMDSATVSECPESPFSPSQTIDVEEESPEKVSVAVSQGS